MSISRILVVSLLLLATIAGAARGQSLPQIRIGIVMDGPWGQNDEIRMLFEREILALTDGEFAVRFPADKSIVADWTFAGVDAAVSRLINDRQVDIVVTLGVLASQNICLRGDLPKPCVAPTVIDAIAQQLPDANGKSGVRNLNYLVIPNNMVRDMRAFRAIVPFTKVAVLLNAALIEAIPNKAQGFRDLLSTIGVRATIHPVGETIGDVLAGLPSDVEAVYAAPLLQLHAAEYEKLIATLIERDRYAPPCMLLPLSR